MEVSSSLQDEQAEEQFTDALTDDDLRIRLMQARPTSLPEALRLAMELESYNEKAPEYEQLKEPKECRSCFWKSGATQGQSAKLAETDRVGIDVIAISGKRAAAGLTGRRPAVGGTSNVFTEVIEVGTFGGQDGDCTLEARLKGSYAGCSHTRLPVC
ncbi:hypothetical protein LSAT2_012530, partial [Lamellibrachia satsuma]